jgi:hypothetical protein
VQEVCEFVVSKGVPTPFAALTADYLKIRLNFIFVFSLIVNTIPFVHAFFRKFKGHTKIGGYIRTCSADYPAHALIG